MKHLNLAIILIVASFTGAELWAIPPGFNIQGRLTDANGINKTGSFNIKFSIYASTNPAVAVWEETKLNVPVANGNFQVVLQGEQLEAAVKDLAGVEVEITVGNEAPMVPRQPLLRSPFSPPTISMLGAVMFFAGPTCPSGWVLANGAVLPESGIYSELAAYLGNTYGAVGQLPNMTDGSFVRGAGGNSSSLGVKQIDAFQGHTHEYVYPAAPWTGTGNGFYMGRAIGGASWLGITGNQTSIQSMSGYGTARADVETRPLNYAMTPCIKY